jgi:hypothetical protein
MERWTKPCAWSLLPRRTSWAGSIGRARSRSSARTGGAISFARCCGGYRETVEGCGFSFARTVSVRAEVSTDGSRADDSPAGPFGRAGAAEPVTNCAMRQRAARSCIEGVEPSRGCSRRLSAPRALTARSHGARRFSHRPKRRPKRASPFQKLFYLERPMGRLRSQENQSAAVAGAEPFLERFW